jgi:hypothetical protein
MIFLKNYTVQRKHLQHTHTPYEHICVKLCLYEHIRRTDSTDHEIHEVITDDSLSTGIMPTTESIASLNPKIDP